jgi:hypothetical protein
MARSRCLPPSLLDDPDYFELDGQTQAILIGLVLCADDHGRGMAHANWLARKLNRDTGMIEAAFTQLQEHRLVQCYQVELQRYYVLLKWWEWEAGLRNPARSKYPEPPPSAETEHVKKVSPTFSEKVRKTSRNLEEGVIPSLEIEVEEEIEIEVEDEEEGEEESQEKQQRSNVVIFPTTTPTTSDDADGQKEPERITHLTHQVAGILKLSAGDALHRIVQDYHADPSLSLLGEADAAREWIDDPQRNKKHKRMSPAFFRHWLQRERESWARREAERTASANPVAGTGTTGRAGEVVPGKGGTAPTSPGAGLASRSLMGLSAQYRRATSQKGNQS